MTTDYIQRLQAEIARREQAARYHDAAEGQAWFNEMISREDNQRCLDHARKRLAAAQKASEA